MSSWEGWVRTIVVGRRNGIRAAIRRELNVATWLDEEAEPAAPQEPEEAEPGPGWQRVAAASELPREGEVVEAFAEDRAVVLVRVDGSFYAVDSVCPHAGGPLGEGELEGTKLTCPWHGWSYDVTTGQSAVDRATCLETFEVRIDGDDVYVASHTGR